MSANINQPTIDYILKAAAVGVPLEIIAAKLSLPVEDVHRAIEDNKSKVANMVDNGFSIYLEHFHAVATNYQRLGDSLRDFAVLIDNCAEIEEICKVANVDLPTAKKIASSFIVLRPISKEKIPQMIEQALKDLVQIRGN